MSAFSGTAETGEEKLTAQASRIGAGELFTINLKAHERAAIARVVAIDALGDTRQLLATGHYVPEVGWSFTSELVSGLSLTVTAPLTISIAVDFGNGEAVEAWLDLRFTQNYAS